MSETQVPVQSLEDYECDLDELESAEDFLTYFKVDFDPAVVHVNRLHILQRFHDYLAGIVEEPDSVGARFALHADLLRGAYQDFVTSDARTEKVFRVFHMNEPPHAEVSLNELMQQLPPKALAPEPHAS
ncbi:MAG: nitrogenase-stabilizing/protective protein NifW [Thiohalocapsa sp.]|jgi:nitrogenase-stabilizing/protective protein